MSVKFIWSQRPDAEGVNLAVHHATKRIIYHSMAREQPLAGKYRRDHGDIKVPRAARRARVPGVFTRVVFNLQLGGRKRRHQQRAHPRHAARRQGSTFLNGLTVTCAYTPALW